VVVQVNSIDLRSYPLVLTPEGLNLTVASRVICVDLWYNKCVEQQGKSVSLMYKGHRLKYEAFARVFRVGQTQETYITRCVVKGTVDERLIAMQEEKTQIISGAMDDRSVMAQLTVTELMRLFGPVAYDENSKPFILVDDDVTIHGDAAQQPKISEDI